MERKNAKLGDLINDLARELEYVQLVERLTCANWETATARVQTMRSQVEDTDAKYANVVDETAKIKKDLCFCISS